MIIRLSKKISLKFKKGSAMVYLLGMIPAMILSFAYVYNSYQLSNEKVRLQNTADAVAYSVGAISAKDLNIKAYTNRAMVANQVAIAQAVSLQSWVRFLDIFVDNISVLTRWIPYLGAAVNAVSSFINAFEQTLAQILGAYILVLDNLNTAYSVTQQAWHFFTIALARDTFAGVARANDPNVETGISLATGASAASFIAAHNQFSQRITANTRERVNGRNSYRMDEFRDVTLRSRDNFSSGRSRNYTFFSLNLGLFRINVPKAGGTELQRDPDGDNGNRPYYTWQAMDTLSFHTRTWRCGFGGCGWRRNETPVGWGGAQATTTSNGLSYREMRRQSYYRTNTRASGLVGTSATSLDGDNNDDRDPLYNSSRFGLRSYYDVRQRGLLEEGPGVLVLLNKPNGADSVKTLRAMDTVPDDSTLDIEEYGGLNRDRMSVSAKAESYFARATDIPGWARRRARAGSGGLGVEYGNMYNPYWQTRLKDLSQREIRTVQVAMGL